MADLTVEGRDVVVEFAADRYTATWPRADVRIECRVPARVEWQRSRGPAFGRAGTWVSADHSTGPSVHVADDDPVVTVTATGRLDPAVTVVDATLSIDAADSSVLVNGYQSWDYSGVRAAAEPALTWWGGAVAHRTGGAGLAFHAATADRMVTFATTEPSPRGTALRVAGGGAPHLQPCPPSWGFHALPEPSPPPWATSEPVTAEPVLLTAAPDARDAMEAVADLAGRAMGALRWDGPPVLGWESWYHYGFSITPETLLANARLLRERFPDRFDLVQLDDGWQRGYGDWRPNSETWPDDLADLTREVRAAGGRPGLWLAPFMVWPGGGGISGRPDLLVGDPAGGDPLVDPLMGRHGVDASHPDALEWLHDLGATVRRWGFEMVKLDFLYIGAQEGRRQDGSTTGTEAMRQGLRVFLDGLGPDVYVLGCGMPMHPGVGLCHGNRVGGDLAAPIDWPFPDLVPFDPADGWRGILPQARNVAARWWVHRHLYDADPDVVMAAGPAEGPPYSVDEARTLATLAALCGGPFFLADDLAALPEAKRAVLEDRNILGHAWNDGFRPADLFATVDVDPDADFFTPSTRIPRRWKARTPGATATFNWGDEPLGDLPPRGSQLGPAG